MPTIPKKRKKKKETSYLDRLTTKIKIVKNNDKYIMVKGKIIEGCGGVIALHKGLAAGSDLSYQLTHTLTGFGLLNSERENLEDLAREFWNSLTKKSQKIWRTSDNPKIVSECVSKKSKAIIGRGQ